MPTIHIEEAVLDEGLWRSWVERGRTRERATARRMKIAAIAILVLAAVGGGLYRLAIG